MHMSQVRVEQTETTMEPGSSKRYKNFYSALQLAMHSASSKWTYEDFKECFPTYCEENPVKSKDLYSQLSEKIFQATKQKTDALLTETNAAEAIDVLQEVVWHAQKSSSDSNRRNIWVPNLEPRAAVHARTVPILEKERNRLRTEILKSTDKNEQLISQLELNEHKKDELEALVTRRLDILDQMVAEYERLPLEKMEQWAMSAEEALGPRS